MALRLCLNSLFRRSYSRHDLMLYMLDRMLAHHLAGLVMAPYCLLAVTFDWTLVVGAHRTVAPMLTDLLRSEGKKFVKQNFFVDFYTFFFQAPNRLGKCTAKTADTKTQQPIPLHYHLACSVTCFSWRKSALTGFRRRIFSGF